MKINIKPLSVNEAWQGKRFKTKKYLKYEKDLFFLLPKMHINNPPYILNIKFGLSSKLSDLDNPLKPFLDILQKKYAINDRDIKGLHLYKEIVPKGLEFVEFSMI